MTDEQGVMPVEAEPTPTSPVEEQQQEVIGTEPVEKPTSDVRGNLKIALQQEREKRKELEARLKERESVQYEQSYDDDVAKRFVKTEADAYIAKKLAMDPTFRDLIPEIEAEMVSTGKTIQQAETSVKAKLFDKILSEAPAPEPTSPPKQLPNTATPESNETTVPKDVESEISMIDDAIKKFSG